MAKEAKPSKMQLDYAMRRVADIARAREKAILARHTTQMMPSSISGQMLVSGIRVGTIRVRKDYLPGYRIGYSDDRHYGNFPRINEIFDLEGDCTPGGAKVDRQAAEPELQVLAEQVQRLKDRIILGDMAEALGLIEQFARDGK